MKESTKGGHLLPAVERCVFFLGGRDLEMVTIKELLERELPGHTYDKGLPWGARASDYREPIEEEIANGKTPVLVEIHDDLGVAQRGAILIDHHGARAGADRPTSLHQVFDLLGLPATAWTRWFDFVAANDRAYISGLQSLGATREEIVKVRAADRAAQGITPAHEAEAERAVADARVLATGALTVVRLSHSRTATVTDRLEPALGGPDYRNLLVISPGQVNFFGDGESVRALDRRFPSGWFGGQLPERGFWGHEEPVPTQDTIVSFLVSDEACGLRSMVRY